MIGHVGSSNHDWLTFFLLERRLQRSNVDMRQFCDSIQGAVNSRFAQMCGAVPAISSLDEKQFAKTIHDFSVPLLSDPVRQTS